MHIRPHENLIAWQRAYQLCLEVYKVTLHFPRSERFGLISQMQRSGYSIPCNIAEGNTKKSLKERSHFFETAHASLEELHCQCRLSLDLGYLQKEKFLQFDDMINRTSYLITKLRDSLG